ncbi:SPFH domain-containing protein [Streptomyces sp. NPDC058440]|uniref:SPFH domain-containing protein n=1 Tax=Streptomyces sp. NPDC058440 TaxID=3346501 RepID=UPI00364F2836
MACTAHFVSFARSKGLLVSLLVALVAVGAIVLVLLFSSIRTVDQAHVAVVTLFGKYRRVLNPGLNLIIPIFERIHRKVPVQNQTSRLQFSAITGDQAAVHFTSTIIFTVSDHSPETVQLVAFKFINDNSFHMAMTSAVEASVREFVSTKKQAEVLGLRSEIVSHAKSTLDEQLASWGYTLVDLTVNDITFDAEVMASMSRVVAAKNAQSAAEFEGQALLITRTKEAEANGAAIRIAAQNEAEAARLRGEGLAQFRMELAKGLSESAQTLTDHGVDPGLLAFTMWTETIRESAKEGDGNVIFLDGSVEGMQGSLRRLQGLTQVDKA